MKVPTFLTINRYHRIISNFQHTQSEANTTQELINESFAKYRKLANNTNTTKKELKEVRKELLQAISYKITHIKKQKSCCQKFVRTIQKNIRKKKQSDKPQITTLIENLTQVTQYLGQIVSNLQEQKKHTKQYNVEKEFNKLLLAQDKIDDNLTTLSESIYSTSALLSRKVRPAATRTVGISLLASSLYFASLVTPTIEGFIDKINPQKPVTAIPQSKPMFTNFESLKNGTWHRFACENMTQSQILEFWSMHKDKDLYVTPTSQNITQSSGATSLTQETSTVQTSSGIFHIEVELKIKPQSHEAEKPKVDLTSTSSAMLISKEEFEKIKSDVADEFNDIVPFEYFPIKLSEKELLNACMRHSAVWEGGFYEHAYKDSKEFQTIGIGCLIHIGEGATTEEDVYWKLRTMGLAKTDAECATVLKELIGQKRKITLAQAQKVFIVEIKRAHKVAKTVFKNFQTLPPDLQIVLVDWSFNMGETELKSWKTTPKLVQNGQILELANSLPKWKWYKDTNRRAWITHSYLVRKYTLIEEKKKQPNSPL